MQGARGQMLVAEGGDHEGWRLAPLAREGVQQVEAGNVGQVLVEEDEVEAMFRDAVQGLGAAAAARDNTGGPFEGLADHQGYVVVVFDEEEAQTFGHEISWGDRLTTEAIVRAEGMVSPPRSAISTASLRECHGERAAALRHGLDVQGPAPGCNRQADQSKAETGPARESALASAPVVPA